MFLSIANILDARQLEHIRGVLYDANYADGRTTAGWAAEGVKAVDQAQPSPAVGAAGDLIRTLVLSNPVVQMAAQPKLILGPRFTRYQTGMTYGRHVDDPVMDGVRIDLAFTLFLDSPDTYGGGELSIETPAGRDLVKLDAGHMILYPATTLHGVAPVTAGERRAAVGWVRSIIRDAHRRELLFDLETARRAIFARDGHSETFDLVSKSAANLVRMWADD